MAGSSVEVLELGGGTERAGLLSFGLGPGFDFGELKNSSDSEADFVDAESWRRREFCVSSAARASISTGDIIGTGVKELAVANADGEIRF